MTTRHLIAYLFIVVTLVALGYGIHRWRNSPTALQRRRRAASRRAKARLIPNQGDDTNIRNDG